MRLVCPNCGAQYDVADEAIPTSGRDVQCSNCSHEWFVERPASVAPQPPQSNPAQENAPESPQEPEYSPPPYHGLDPEVAAVLQEEAEREARARAAESQTNLQTQTEMGLSQPAPEPTPPAAEPLDARVEIRTIDEAFETGAPAATQTDVLPDVEGITSTLRADVAPAETMMSVDAEVMAMNERSRRRGFRGGFFLVLIVAALLAAAYLYAAQIEAQFPAATPYLDPYVTFVDGIRLWLHGLVAPYLSSAPSSEG